MKLIVEIGVSLNGWEKSSGKVICDNKSKDCVYLGIDIRENVTKLAKPDENIFTLFADSKDVEENLEQILKHGDYIDLLLIDGNHSVNTVSREWDYVPYVRPNGGTIVLHDTTNHPGPWCLMKSVDPDIFEIYEHCTDDNGLGVLVRK